MQFEVATRQKTVWALILLAACFVTYANGIFGAFTYDDKAVVRDDPRIRSPRNLCQIFATSYFGGPRGAGSAYRPLLLLSYSIQWWIHGRDVVAFHVVNILFHSVATLLLAALLLRIDLPPPIVAAASLLFAVHPIHVESVTSLVGRGETQAAVFVLLYLLVALRWAGRREAVGGRRAAVPFLRLPPTAYRLPLLFLALLCYAAALLTKESASVAPALAFLLLFFLEEGSLPRRLAAVLGRYGPLWLLSTAVLAGTFELRAWVLGGPLRAPKTGVFEVENALAHLRPGPRAVNACVNFFRYLGRCVLPLHLSADESAWSIRPVPPFSRMGLVATFLLIALLLAALAGLRNRSPLALGFMFFAMALLPTSNLLFPTGTIFAERLAYLPSAGICLVLGALLTRVVPAAQGAAVPAQGLPLPRGGVRGVSPHFTSAPAATEGRASGSERPAGRSEGGTSALVDLRSGSDFISHRGFLFVLILLFSGRAILRNAVWWTDEGLFANLIATSPESAKAHYDVAYIAVANHRYEQALTEYSRAVEIYPRYWDAWAGRGRTLRETGNLAEAERSYEEAIAANGDYENGYFGLGEVREARGNFAGAEAAYRSGLKKNPNSLPLAYHLALLSGRSERPSAEADWQRAVRLGSHSAAVRAEHARWLARQGREEEATREAREALRRDPVNLPALCLLAEKARAHGERLAEELALEGIYWLNRSPEDRARLQELWASDPELASRGRVFEKRWRDRLAR